ncbi:MULTISPECIES: hypothetical protein [unclassified Bradyrhizobium]|uniref:hypothetical protein n=1 Tax=unclassified Bradyrhizobium TaxID=2631580 RepID=UPI002916A895|nr:MULTISPECIES: hypothetical protein [unclassified Bradyrhizobium]
MNILFVLGKCHDPRHREEDHTGNFGALSQAKFRHGHPRRADQGGPHHCGRSCTNHGAVAAKASTRPRVGGGREGVVGPDIGGLAGDARPKQPRSRDDHSCSVTLIEAHEIRRKRQQGFFGERRGREAAALDTVGAVLGSLGMLAFAAVFSTLVQLSVATAFAAATTAWLVVSVTAWAIRRKLRVAATARKAAGRCDTARPQPPLVSSRRR